MTTTPAHSISIRITRRPGCYSVIFKASDWSKVDSEIVQITVNNVNRPPLGTSKTVTATQDVDYTVQVADFGFTDPYDVPPNNFQSVVITSLPVKGTLELSGVAVTLNQEILVSAIIGNNLKYRAASGESGTPYTTLEFKVRDDGGTANGGIDLDVTARTMTINVTSVNNPPVGTSKTVTATEDEDYTVQVADFGFTDPNDVPPNNFLSVVITSLPAKGTLKLSNIDVTLNQEILVSDINTNNLKYRALPNENGTAYSSFQFKVRDDGGGTDLDEIARTMTINVTAVNDPPVVTDIPDQTIAEGESFTAISLDDYVSDPDNGDMEMIWTYSGNSQLLVSIVDRVATISTTNPDWYGSESITFKAADSEGLFSSDAATFTVSAVNDPPVVTDIPGQTIAEGGSFTAINLDDYVSDPDNSDAEMIWTYSGNTQLSVSIVDRVATISAPNPDWYGSETITFKATDPGGLFSTDAATFIVLKSTSCPPNMTHYWKLNETSGSTYDDFVGTGDANCSGPCPSPATGIVDGAQSFAGAQRVVVADDGTFDWGPSSSFSIEFWMRKNSLSSTVEAITGRTQLPQVWQVGVWSDSRIYLQLKDNGGEVNLTSKLPIAAAVWYHVVVVRDGSANTVSLYKDGIQDTTTSMAFPQGFSSSAPMTIGWFESPPSYFYYRGLVDEVALYDRAITVQEIQDHYDRGRLGGIGYCDEVLVPIITSTPQTTALGGRMYTYDVEAMGNPAPTFALTTHPAGMTIDGNSGLVTWNPAAIGDYGVTVIAENSAGADTQSFSINVPGVAPTVTSTPVTTATAGTPYVCDVDASGDPTPLFCLFTSYAGEPFCPTISGIQINTTTGLITWTPSNPGVYQVCVLAYNTWGSDTQSFAITVSGVPPTITSTPTTTAYVGQVYQYDVNATAYPAAAYSLRRPPTPTQMEIDSITGLITWTPSSTGLVDVIVVAKNDLDSAVQSFVIDVKEQTHVGCPEGLSHYWRLDEPSGSSYSDSIGNNSATCGICPVTVPGKVGNAKLFDISTRVEIADDDTFDWGSDSSFSIEFWMFKSSGCTDNEVILGRFNAGIYWWIGVDCASGKKSRFRLYDGTNTDLYGVSSVADSSWHHVVATRNGMTHESRLYVDGTLQQARSQDHTVGFASSVPITMGYFNLGGLYHYGGQIDEVALYRVPLSASEVSAHYAMGLQGYGYCQFICGDPNQDAAVDVSDVVYLIGYIFGGGPEPSPRASGDANCDAAVDISDAVYLIGYIFGGGPAPCDQCN